MAGRVVARAIIVARLKVRLLSRQLPLRSTATSRLYRPCRSSHSLHSPKLSARQPTLVATLRAKTGGKGITLPLVHPIMKALSIEFTSTPGGFGGKGIRTPDLLIANETLYQLSYTPEIFGRPPLNVQNLVCISTEGPPVLPP